MEFTQNRYHRGLQQLNALDALAGDRVVESLKEIAPDMAGFIIAFGYGDIYSRPGLDVKSRQIATIAALTALGNADPQLRFHIGAALNIGVTPEEIIETIYVTSLPEIARDFNVTHNVIELTLTSYLAGFGVGVLLWGSISDIYGRKPIFIIGFIIYAIACLGCYFSSSVESMFILRFIQALGASVGSVLGQQSRVIQLKQKIEDTHFL